MRADESVSLFCLCFVPRVSHLLSGFKVRLFWVRVNPLLSTFPVNWWAHGNMAVNGGMFFK